MYNYTQKDRYIETRLLESSYTKEQLELVFCKTEPYEKELDKDICDFSLQEIIDMYKRMNFSSFFTIANYHKFLRTYAIWCLSEKLIADNQNHFTELNSIDLPKYINKLAIDNKIFSRDQLLNVITQLKNPKDQFILIALFEIGKSKDFQDIIHARIEDINYSTNTIKLNGRIAEVSNEFIHYAKVANETLEYEGAKGKILPLVENGRIVKNNYNTMSESDFNEGRRIYMTVKRVMENLGLSKWITPNSLVESGKIHLINTIVEKENITVKDFFTTQSLVKIVEEQYNCKLYNKAKGYYEKYKEYFI